MNDTNKKQDQFWSGYSSDYLKNLYQETREYPSLIIRHNYILDLLDSEGLEKKTIVDIGCGPGEMISELVDRGHVVFGLDIAEGMLEVAKANIKKKHPEYEPDLRCGNIEELEYQHNTFDCIICAGVIEYLENDHKALSELNRILKPGGILIITVRNKVCPLRFIDFILDMIKETKFGLGFLNKIRKFFNKEPIHFISYRKHSPWKFDKNLSLNGFEKTDFRYFHFYPFFIPFDKFFPSLFIKLGLKMEKMASRRIAAMLASGYIVKAIKKNK